MSLKRLLEKIEEDARQEGGRIVAAARERAERVEAQGIEEARRAADAIRENFRDRGRREGTRIMSEALSESRAAFLAAQEELYEEAFAAALAQFEALPQDRYRAWLKRTILANACGGEEMLAAPFDRRLLEEGLLDEVNQVLRERDGKEPLGLAAGEAAFSRGVILTAEGFVNDLSLEALMREVRERHEEEVLKMLFGSCDVRGAGL